MTKLESILKEHIGDSIDKSFDEALNSTDFDVLLAGINRCVKNRDKVTGLLFKEKMLEFIDDKQAIENYIEAYCKKEGKESKSEKLEATYKVIKYFYETYNRLMAYE